MSSIPQEIHNCKRILGTFTVLDGYQCPTAGIVVLADDPDEADGLVDSQVLDLLVEVHNADGTSELKWTELEPGTEFRFETRDTIFVDEWAWNASERLSNALLLCLAEVSD